MQCFSQSESKKPPKKLRTFKTNNLFSKRKLFCQLYSSTTSDDILIIIKFHHCETKPFRWQIWMQNPAKNEVSDMNFQICLESVLIHSKWSKLVPEHPPGPKKRFLTTKHPQNNFNKFFQNSKFAAQNDFLAFSSKQALKTRFGGQV